MGYEDDNLGVFRFGEFTADAKERVLERDGESIPLTPRVFDTLLAFLRQPDVPLTKDELLTTIWHSKLVEESNLVQNVAVLRRTLNDAANERRFIATIPGRGYRFIADVVRLESDVCRVESVDKITSQMTKASRRVLDGPLSSRHSPRLQAVARLAPRSVRRGSPILFCGFYEVSEKKGYFKKTHLSRMLEKEFYGAFESCFRNHGVQDYHAIKVSDAKTPAMIHRWCDCDRFDRFLAHYGRKALGIIWGTVDKDGIKTLEAKLNSGLNVRNPRAEEQINRLVGVLNRFELRPEQRARYLGTVWAALWCQSFCNDIAFGGNWQAAHRLAAESRRMIEDAAHNLSPNHSQKRALALLTKCYCQTHAFQ